MGIQVLEEEIPGISHPRIKVSSLLKGLFLQENLTRAESQKTKLTYKLSWPKRLSEQINPHWSK